MSKRILSSGVIIIVCVLFILYLDKTWLNRTGIFLNFLAGFMLAPELIGEERIKKWGLRFNWEAIFADIHSQASHKHRTNLLHLATRKESIIVILLMGCCVVVGGITAFFAWNSKIYIWFYPSNMNPIVNITLAIIAIMIELFGIFWISIIFNVFNVNDEKFLLTSLVRLVSSILVSSIIVMLLPVVVLSLAISGMVFVVLYFISWISSLSREIKYKILSMMYSRVQDEKRLREIILLAGIIFFIIGNLFQFFAT